MLKLKLQLKEVAYYSSHPCLKFIEKRLYQRKKCF